LLIFSTGSSLLKGWARRILTLLAHAVVYNGIARGVSLFVGEPAKMRRIALSLVAALATMVGTLASVAAPAAAQASATPGSEAGRAFAPMDRMPTPTGGMKAIRPARG
jgi:hypothetical protein